MTAPWVSAAARIDAARRTGMVLRVMSVVLCKVWLASHLARVIVRVARVPKSAALLMERKC